MGGGRSLICLAPARKSAGWTEPLTAGGKGGGGEHISASRRFLRGVNEQGKMSMLTTTEAAYIAGLLDGEGCLAIYRRSKTSYVCLLRVAMTHKATLDWLSVRLKTSVKKRSSTMNKDTAFSVTTSDPKIIKVLLEATEPFMITKKANARLLLDYINKVQNKEREDLQIYAEISSVLNARGEGANERKLDIAAAVLKFAKG